MTDREGNGSWPVGKDPPWHDRCAVPRTLDTDKPCLGIQLLMEETLVNFRFHPKSHIGKQDQVVDIHVAPRLFRVRDGNEVICIPMQ